MAAFEELKSCVKSMFQLYPKVTNDLLVDSLFILGN